MTVQVGERSLGASRSLRLFSLGLLILGLLVGDVAMIAIVGLARLVTDVVVAQWALSTLVIAAGDVLIFGLPQLLAWGGAGASQDPRARLALRLLHVRTTPRLVAASLLGGAGVVALASVLTNDPRAKGRTVIAGCLLAAFWSAFYLGMWTAVSRAL